MMVEKIRVGVVGLGAFGSHHARHYSIHPAAKLVAVVDADPERACVTAEKYAAAALADHRDLIGKVDAVSVTVPASLHHAIATDLIAAGIHLFVEKPLATDGPSAADLVARAAAAGTILQVGHIERFSAPFRELAKRAPRPARIEAVRHTPWNGRSTDVDVVLDLMIHDIDLALALVCEPVVAVAGRGRAVKSAHSDEADAVLRFAGGVEARLSASRVADAPQRTLRVETPGAIYVADLGGRGLSVTADGRTETVMVTPHDNLGAEIDAFLASVANGAAPEVDGRAGLAAVEVADRILAAIASTASNGDMRQ